MPGQHHTQARAAFCTTHWSLILEAGRSDSPRADEALGELCRAYWYPLYAFIRRRESPPAEAEDLTQAFFERLLAKNYITHVTPGTGRFRSFLLTSLKHFLANEWDRAQTAKRGGGKVIISLDAEDPEVRYGFEPVDSTTPELLFDKRWALTVLERVLGQLRSEFAAAQKSATFDQLKLFLSADDPDVSYGEMAARIGQREGAVKVAVHRLRRRYGELLRAEIAQTVDDPAEVEEELRYLIHALGS